MPNLKTAVLKLLILGTLAAIAYFAFLTNDIPRDKSTVASYSKLEEPPPRPEGGYNVWLIFTKVTKRSPLKYKFHSLLANILNVSSVPLKFHIIVDNGSKQLAIDEISDVVSEVSKVVHYKLYDVEESARAIGDIVNIMTPHFSSKPGTYYSDALFYISLGLHRIAPYSQERAILLDCDLYFKKDIALLFREFDSFKPSALFGLAPELTPVYRHVLHLYRSKHNTTFGEYYHSRNVPAPSDSSVHPRGFQGYNSGVVLLQLGAIRHSREYPRLISNRSVNAMTAKYKFRGHLGDQDFYTLMGFEQPHLIQTLNCGFNRQLCVWWRDHGYRDVFGYYFRCPHPVVVLHGNCNTKIPK